MAFVKTGDSELLEIIKVTNQIEQRFITCPHCKTIIEVNTVTKICPKCGGSLLNGRKNESH